ncbi:MAG TPA: glycerol-3-phosphate dehydrogenase/oxidase [Thermoanaerobaculia bacterium]|jgi:glycerol-3-phosphate dehydrogenase|nr:glycerol-3-phosphate dehydrogenase/oxidase [Thermoanaerobaculia bacterium]
MLSRLLDPAEVWDVLVVGGGATGLGAAVEAAARGYRTALIEGSDFAKGTSSRSTKLVHGGVRYLQRGNVSLVLEALRERGRLLRNAPHLVRNLDFLVPRYDWWEAPFYGAGLKLYDLLAGRMGLAPSRLLSREETLDHVPTLEPKGLRGAVIYQDAQFNDARLAVTLARTLADLGGVAVNYVRAVGLRKEDGLVRGVRVHDLEKSTEAEARARVVVNATGVFSDDLRRMDDPESPLLLSPSQGIHLVLDRRFQPGASAILVPHTDDGRVLFAVPWLDRVVVGTTDTPIPVTERSLEPRPLPEEIEFLLQHAARYLTQDPRPEDVLSCFAGLRPLVRGGRAAAKTAALARDHTLLVSTSGLVTITGGKWTTYRKMGEDAIDQAALVAGLDERPSPTATLRLHGWTEPVRPGTDWAEYGSDAPALADLAAERPGWDEPLHFNLPYRACEAVWAVRHEMARTVEDVLARRTRALLLDARASASIAPAVAGLMAEELGKDEAWQRNQVETYRELARAYWL